MTPADARAAVRGPGAEIVSSVFLMALPWLTERPVVIADCALVISPSAAELVSIAISSARSYEAMTGDTAWVALLSLSTTGRTEHESVERVRESAAIARAEAPQRPFSGLQHRGRLPDDRG